LQGGYNKAKEYLLIELLRSPLTFPSWCWGRRVLASKRTLYTPFWEDRKRLWSKSYSLARCPWLVPVILTTQEAEIRRTAVWSQSRKIVLKTLSRKNSPWARRVAQGVGPKFKPQYCQEKKKERKSCASPLNLLWHAVSMSGSSGSYQHPSSRYS
jgi:hypothetical protein